MSYKDQYKKGDLINGFSMIIDVWVEKENSMATFLCHCGNEFTTRMRSIVGGKTKSCGCLQKKAASTPRNNYVKGDLIGVLTFLNRVEGKPGEPRANFLCECGNEFVTKIQSAKSLETKSCGCKSRELTILGTTKHESVGYFSSGVKRMPVLPPEHAHRFWSKVAITAQPNLCWDWQATGGRYGHFKVGKADYKSNRIAYWLHYKVDPAEMEVTHICDNPKCCNPAHLSLGTHTDNMRDMIKKGRGDFSGLSNAKLNEDQVRDIRGLAKTGESIDSLADMYGVKYSTIRAILKGITWKNIS